MTRRGLTPDGYGRPREGTVPWYRPSLAPPVTASLVLIVVETVSDWSMITEWFGPWVEPHGGSRRGERLRVEMRGWSRRGEAVGIGLTILSHCDWLRMHPHLGPIEQVWIRGWGVRVGERV